MRKYLLYKKSKGHQADQVTIEKESTEPKRGQIGTINLTSNQMGKKAPKPKFNNNPHKVLKKIKRRK